MNEWMNEWRNKESEGYLSSALQSAKSINQNYELIHNFRHSFVVLIDASISEQSKPTLITYIIISLSTRCIYTSIWSNKTMNE